MVDKVTRRVVIGAFFVVALFAILSLTGVLQLAFASSFTPVYCNDPGSTCCVKTERSESLMLSDDGIENPSPSYSAWQCPRDAVSCEIVSYNSNILAFYVSSSVPSSTCAFLCTNKYLDASDKVEVVNPATPYTLKSGQYLWAFYDVPYSVTVKVYRQKLVTNLGIPVPSDSCTFSPSSSVKLTDGSGREIVTSYTVPVGAGVGTMDSCVATWVAGQRHICGNLEEQCSMDSDCVGHTYGNKECYQRTLQTYGCRKLGAPSGLSSLWGGDTLYAPLGNEEAGASTFSGVTARCEVVSTSGVQCCGDTDCGSSLVCDTTSFTCKPPAETPCRQNSDCGVSVQCDFSTLRLKTPVCSMGKCSFTTKSVGCCADSNCADDEFCNSIKQCELRNPDVKFACPFGCCVGESKYFDKACSSGQYCVRNVCQSAPGCSRDSDCLVTEECVGGECVLKDVSCPAKLGGLVSGTQTTIQSCPFLSACWLGLAKPEAVAGCQYDYTLVLVLAGVLLVVVGLIVFAGRRGGNKGRVRVSGGAIKWVLIVLAVLVAIFLLSKYIVWIIVGIVVLSLLDTFLFGGIIKKLVIR